MWFPDPAARLRLAAAPSAAPTIRWEGYLRNGSGYGEEGRATALGLARRGHSVSVLTAHDVPGFVDTLPTADAEVLSALCAREPHPDDLVVQNLVPSDIGRRALGGYQVARTTFETDGLPSSWLVPLAQVDEIWVPTTFNVETFRSAGVRTPIHVVPQGVDAELYRPGVAPLPLGGAASAVFLGVAAWGWDTRKGWDVLLDAWARAFAPGDDVLLVLKVSPVPGHRDEFLRQTDAWIDAQLGRRGRSRRDCAPILVLGDHVRSADMPRLYAAATAVVLPSRGEGFGRPALEAMSCGVPVIATRWGGSTAFLTDDNSLPLEIDGLSTIGDDEPIENFRGQRWANPCRRHLVELLQAVVRDPAASTARGVRARADVVANWTWDRAIDAAEERITDIWRRTHRRPPRVGATRVRWQGDQYAVHSLSGVNREITARLVVDDSLDVELHSREVDPDPRLVAAAPLEQVQATGAVLSAPAQVTVRHQWPPDWTPPAEGAWVVIQPWEFGALPQEWVDGLRGVDEVWCPSTWVRKCYELSGVPTEKLHVIPNGVDVDLFTPEGPRYPLKTRATTKLLFCGGAIHRKGIDVLVQAYCGSFTPDDDICLVIKAHGSRSTYANSSVLDQIRGIAARPDAPAIEVIDEDLTPEQLAALYRSCDILVHPYRGEGFAMPVAEAMASGLPVVVTTGGATSDFCDASTAYLVPAEVVEIPGQGLGPGAGPYFWAEPDRLALAALLRDVVGDPVGRRATGQRGRARIQERFTWDGVSALVTERVRTLAATVPVRERPVPALATRSRNTQLHSPDWNHLSADDVLQRFLTGHQPGDGVCLVLTVDPEVRAVDHAVSAVHDLVRTLGLAEEDVPELLLVPVEVSGIPALAASVRGLATDLLVPRPRQQGAATVSS